MTSYSQAELDARAFKVVKPLMDTKQYQRAVPILFKLGYGYSKKISLKQKITAQQWLGVALFRLGYNQAAAFPLIATVGQGDAEISEKSLLTLVQITDQLKDKSLLNYAISKLDINSKISKETFYTKSAEVFISQDQAARAEENYLKALQINPQNENALYQLGLLELKKNNVKLAYGYFQQLEALYANKSNLDEKKGLASLAIARTLYQSKQWQNAIETYRSIPKNYEYYRQSQFELAWAQFRSLNFRAALSSIETLQTPFYETFYDPESLILRMIILLFICQREDIESSIKKYETTYESFPKDIDRWLQRNAPNAEVLGMINQTNLNLKLIRNGYQPKFKTALPFYFVRTLLDDKKIKDQLQLVDKLKNEKSNFRKSALAANKTLSAFFEKIYSNRLLVTQRKLITDFRQAVSNRLAEAKEFNSQFELIRYEALNLKKTQLKISTRMTEAEKSEFLNATHKSNYYTENGFRYWPFQGEFWVDEIGSYQYVGINRCMNE